MKNTFYIKRSKMVLFLCITVFYLSPLLAQNANYQDLRIASVKEVYEDSLNNRIERENLLNVNSSNISTFENFLSGNWGGIRNTFQVNGLDFQFIYKGEIFSSLSGGIERGYSLLDNTDIIINADMEKLLGWKNGSILLQFLGNSGDSPSDLAGVMQGISNIETIPTWKIYQLLFQQKFFDEKFSVLFGLFDLNSEFDFRETSSIFLNPSYGIGPEFSQSGLNGPSIFPTTSLSLMMKYNFENGYFLKSALFDGVPGNPDNPLGTQIILNKDDGLLLISETGIENRVGDKLVNKYSVGLWMYTSDFEMYSLDENIKNYEKNFGAYINIEKLITELSSSQAISFFFRVGYANQNVNPVDSYLGFGLYFSRILSENDQLGFAFSYEHNSQSFLETIKVSEKYFPRQYEIEFEATYSYQITKWLSIQPDLQYFINPTFCKDSNHCLLFGSRIKFSI